MGRGIEMSVSYVGVEVEVEVEVREGVWVGRRIIGLDNRR